MFFPFGTYKIARIGTAAIKAYLYVPSNTKLLFEQGATLKRTDSVSAHMVMTKNAASATGYTGATNISIEGAIFDCGSGETAATGICLSHTDIAIIKDCIFKNGTGGHYIEVNSSRFVTIENCDFQSASDTIMYLQIESAAGHGNGGQDDDTPAYNVNICGCRFAKGTTSSMAICNEDEDDTLHDIRIHECEFSGDTGVNGYIKFLSAVTNVDIYNNTFLAGETSASRAVVIGDATGSCTVHDNRFGTFVSAIDGTPVKYNNMIAGELANS